jgi:hypothetical protein
MLHRSKVAATAVPIPTGFAVTLNGKMREKKRFMFRQSVTLLNAEVDRPLRADYLVKFPGASLGCRFVQQYNLPRRRLRPFYSSCASTGVDTVTDPLNKETMRASQSLNIPASRLRDLDGMLDAQMIN